MDMILPGQGGTGYGSRLCLAHEGCDRASRACNVREAKKPLTVPEKMDIII